MSSLARKLADRIAAQFALFRARRLLATAPIGELTARRAADAAAVAEPVATESTERAEALADAVKWTASHGLFRPFCLVQSLALQELLRSEGISGSEIRVGVRRDGASLKAHAWVRWNARVLGDDPRHVSGFTEVDDIRVLGVK